MKHGDHINHTSKVTTSDSGRSEQSAGRRPAGIKGWLGSHLWKFAVVVAVIWFFLYIPTPGYELYAKRKALAEILELTEPLQEYYSAYGMLPIVPDQLDIALSGQYLIPRDDDGLGGQQFDWSVTLAESMITIEIGPGFSGAQRYTINLIPVDEGGATKWKCVGGTLPDRFRERTCPAP